MKKILFAILLSSSIFSMEKDIHTTIAHINEDQNALEGYFSSLFDMMSVANIPGKPSAYVNFCSKQNSGIDNTIETKHMQAHMYVGKLIVPRSTALDAKFAELLNDEPQNNEKAWQMLKKHFLDTILRPAFNEYKKLND
ncbi:hypothetical protein Noda2021_11460 [Candidatus Dependentiae bacterium Noda2021]|nr:hypothetical protein Noda2021_11460 [Candidatus Dependentiae bacterium Noda2021]